LTIERNPNYSTNCIPSTKRTSYSRMRTITRYFTEDMVFFFDPDDIDSMGEAIRTAFRSEGDRLTRATEARRFLDKYGWEHHKRGLTEMYQAL